MTGCLGQMRPSSAGWIARRCAIGCTGSTPKAPQGPDGLVNCKAPGASRKLTPKQLTELAELVETGPDFATDGIVRWRRIDVQMVIQRRFSVSYHERSVSRLLHQLGFSHISSRPRHPKQDAEAIQAFKKTSPQR